MDCKKVKFRSSATLGSIYLNQIYWPKCRASPNSFLSKVVRYGFWSTAQPTLIAPVGCYLGCLVWFWWVSVSSVYDFPSAVLIVSVSWSPLTVRASIMIFALIPSRTGFRVSVFGLRFPVRCLDRVCLLKSSHGQSFHHDLCSDSVKNGISSFGLRFPVKTNGFSPKPNQTTEIPTNGGNHRRLGCRSKTVSPNFAQTRTAPKFFLGRLRTTPCFN